MMRTKFLQTAGVVAAAILISFALPAFAQFLADHPPVAAGFFITFAVVLGVIAVWGLAATTKRTPR